MPKSKQQRLVDLEELTIRIQNQHEKEFFDEAIQCYFIGALRASIILAWIVATDNLTGKLELLAKEDGEARKRWNSIQIKRQKDENFEEDLLNSFGPGALDIFDLRQLQQLQYVRRIRNWCAHATEYQPTPEEARNCLRLLIDIALSVPTYRGYRYISQLTEQIKDSGFLPPQEYQPVVSDILSKIRPGLYKTISEKLVEIGVDPMSTRDTVQNIKCFLGAMLQILDTNANLQVIIPDVKRLVIEALPLSCDVISHCPNVVSYLDFQERERIIRYLFDDGYARSGQSLLEDLLRIELVINKQPESILRQIESNYHLVPSIVKQYSPQLINGIYEQIIKDLEYDGSSNFAKNNEAAADLQKLGFEFFNGLTYEEKHRLIRAIVGGALNGSNGPKHLVSGAKNWPEDWLRILGTEFPVIFSAGKRVLGGPSLLIDVLSAWLTTNERLPDSWNPFFSTNDRGDIAWYTGEIWKLYESLQDINESMKKIGTQSDDLEKFLVEIVPF